MTLFVDFFADTARLRRENAQFHNYFNLLPTSTTALSSWQISSTQDRLFVVVRFFCLQYNKSYISS